MNKDVNTINGNSVGITTEIHIVSPLLDACVTSEVYNNNAIIDNETTVKVPISANLRLALVMRITSASSICGDRQA